MTIPTVAITFDQYIEAYSTAYPMLNNRNLVATFFVDPDMVTSGAPGFTRDALTQLKMNGWTIGAYSGINLATAMGTDRNIVMNRFASIISQMTALGFPVRSLAAAGRGWTTQLRNLARGTFAKVRVASGYLPSCPQELPLPDPLFVMNGGTASLGASDTAASLDQAVTDFLQLGGFWSIVIHKVGDTPDSYAVSTQAFTALANRLATEVAAGNLRVVGYDDL
jgi:hypothetical protein